MPISPTVLDNAVVTSAGPWVTNSVSGTGPFVIHGSVTEFGGGTAPTSLAASGCGLSWSAVNNVDNAAGLVSAWVLKGVGTPTPGTITVTPTGGSSLKEFNYSVVDWGAGADPSAPIVQSATGTAASANPQVLAITLGALADAANNATAQATGGGSTAAPTGGVYTELSDLMNNVALEVMWKLPGNTTPSCTGDSAFFAQAGVAYEIAAAPIPPTDKGTIMRQTFTSHRPRPFSPGIAR